MVHLEETFKTPETKSDTSSTKHLCIRFPLHVDRITMNKHLHYYQMGNVAD